MAISHNAETFTEEVAYVPDADEENVAEIRHEEDKVWGIKLTWGILISWPRAGSVPVLLAATVAKLRVQSREHLF